MVEHLTNNPEIKGLNPALREKKNGNKILSFFSGIDTVVHYMTHYPNITGLNTSVGTRIEKIKKLIIWPAAVAQW